MMKDSHQPPISRHSPLPDLQISPSTTPISSPISTWSPPSSDSGDPSHNVAQNVWGSTVTDQQQQQPPPHSAANKKHCRSFSEASQLQHLNVYHRRLSDGERRSASMSEVKTGISPKSSTTQKHQTSEEDALDTSPLPPPPHENQIIIFGTKTSQNNASQASSGHRYVCQDCNKTFARPSSLRVHSYSHTGEKPYACPDPACGRRFSVCSNLRRHMRVHRLRHDPPQWKPKASIESSSPCRATSI